jgi:hypothetical protein
MGLYMFTLLLSFKQGSLLLNLEPFMLAIILGRYEYILKCDCALEESGDESVDQLATPLARLPTV